MCVALHNIYQRVDSPQSPGSHAFRGPDLSIRRADSNRADISDNNWRIIIPDFLILSYYIFRHDNVIVFLWAINAMILILPISALKCLKYWYRVKTLILIHDHASYTPQWPPLHLSASNHTRLFFWDFLGKGPLFFGGLRIVLSCRASVKWYYIYV